VLVARRFLVSGRVQGVGFRYFTIEVAAAEALHGWVRNLADGRVEVLAEGDREAIDRLERRLRRGPPAGRVDAVEVFEEAPARAGGGFRVRS
jgi:acylphosphatase